MACRFSGFARKPPPLRLPRRRAKKKALPLPPAARLPFSDNSSTFKCALETNSHGFFSVRDRKKKRTQKVGSDSEPSRGRLQPNRCAERDFLRKRKRSAISLWRRGSPEQGLEPVTHASCGIRGPVKQALYGEKERQRGMQVFGLCTETTAASLAATSRKKEGASSATGSAPSFFR